jgi:segregation and condensation protein B
MATVEPTTKRPRAGRGGRRDPAARLRAAAFAWLRGGAQKAQPARALWAGRAPRDPTARLRAAAWAQLRKRAPAKERAAAQIQPAAISPVVRKHLKGLIEALIFASEKPMPGREIARAANAEPRVVRELLAELVAEYEGRGFRLDEVAGGYVFRTSPAFAPFVREMTEQKPARMSRAQLETLAIVAYRQPITRPEIDEVRGVDSGAALKSLLERDLVRILGKKDEPGRPMLYGTTPQFLEFFGLKALGDLPTLREFTELTDESRRAYEREMGEDVPDLPFNAGVQESFAGGEGTIQVTVSANTGEGEEASGPELGSSHAAEDRPDEDEEDDEDDEDEDDEDEDDEDEDEDDEDDEDEDDEAEEDEVN